MKKLLFLFLLTGCSWNLHAQDAPEASNDSIILQFAAVACKCIDSVATFDVPKEEIAKQVNACINRQVVAYQMMSKLLEANSAAASKKIEVQVNVNENSSDYKQYYYALERFLMGHCPVLKTKIGSNDRVAEKSMSKDPEALGHYDRGVKLEQQEDYTGALKAFQEAVRIDPEFAFAWDNIGICFRKLGQYDSALNAYRKSLTIDPNGLMPLQNIPVVHLYKKEFEAAIKAYDALAAVDPGNPEVYYGIGSIYVQYLNDPEKGLDFLCKAYNLYVSQKSPYRSDAEKLISQAYQNMKAQGKSDRFMEILKDNQISVQ